MKAKMKKNLIRAVVLTTLCCVGSAVALIPANTTASAASFETGKFQMIDGASVRAGSELIGGVTGDGKNGIRFSAEIDVDTYDTLVATNDSVTAGTFIMPYDYIGWYGELTETSLFDEDEATYYWQTEGFDTTETDDDVYDKATDDRTQIRHVAGKVYKTNSEIQTGTTPVTVYRVNGSLVDMLDENLGRSLVGVSYLAATKDGSTTYYFAETDFAKNQRSIASVSQNILLSDDATNTEETIATDYLETYIDVNPNLTVDVKADCYKVNEDGFTKVDTIVADTVEINEVADFTKDYTADTTESPTLAGYTYADGHQKNVLSGKMKLDGTACYAYYFYEDWVLYDASYASTVSENLTKFLGKVNVTSGGNLDITNGWTPNAYEIDTKSDGKGSICASKYETGFGVGEAIRWADFGSGTSIIEPDWSWDNKTSYVEITPSMKLQFTMRVKTIQDPSIDEWNTKTLAVKFGFLNAAKNAMEQEVNIVDQIKTKAQNDGWYTITGTLDFSSVGSGAKHLTKMVFTTATATNVHLDIDYISLKAA